MTTAGATVWPASDVPPPLGSTATPRRRATSTAAMTSRSDLGSTTPRGRIW